MVEIDSILSLPLKITSVSLMNKKLHVECQSDHLRWLLNRYFYKFEIDIDTTQQSLIFGFNNGNLTGQTFLKYQMDGRIILDHPGILYSSTPGQTIALMHNGKISLKGTEKYRELKIKRKTH